jgi:hypothetical protein
MCWKASLGAIDGSVTSDVKRQLETIPLDATHTRESKPMSV